MPTPSAKAGKAYRFSDAITDIADESRKVASALVNMGGTLRAIQNTVDDIASDIRAATKKKKHTKGKKPNRYKPARTAAKKSAKYGGGGGAKKKFKNMKNKKKKVAHASTPASATYVTGAPTP
ncbi:hypothetical protein [Bradyrhizobium sp.]